MFDRAQPEIQAFLTATAILPELRVTIARALTGYREAGQLLDWMHGRHLFTERHSDDQDLYQYHGLFREFLLHRLRAGLDTGAMRALQRRAGVLLTAHGQFEAGVALLLEAGDWLAASAAIATAAPGLLRTGRHTLVQRWTRALPAFLLDGNPRLLHCLGRAQVLFNPGAARAALERAWPHFAAAGDRCAQALTAAALLETFYFEFDSYLGADRWIDALQAVLRERPSFSAAEDELRVYTLLLTVMAYRRPADPCLLQYAEHVNTMLLRRLEVNERVVAATMLLTWLDWFAVERSHELVALVLPLLREGALTPFNRVRWLLAEMAHWHFQGDRERMLGAVEQLREATESSGLRTPPVAGQLIGLWSAGGREIERAQARVAAQLATLGHTGRRQDALLLHVVLGESLLQCGNVAGATEHATRALGLAIQTGHQGQAAMAQWQLAAAQAMAGLVPAASDHLQGARAAMPGTGDDKLWFCHLLLDAYIALRAGDRSAAGAALRAGLARGRRGGYLDTYLWLPQLMSAVLTVALEEDIEPEYARRLIQARSIPPADPGSARWPWRIRIRCLGAFVVEIDGVVLTFRGKAPRRPLELLKGLVAHGGEHVDAQGLWEELWQDADGDAAADAFAMALHRLRRLLGLPAALLLEDGKLSLSRDLCWLDTWAFDRLLGLAPAQHERAGQAACQAQALAIYRGAFLHAEPVQPWILPARDRYRSRMLRTVQALAQSHADAGRWLEAAEVHRAAIEIEPFAEPLFQGWMRCLLEAGQHAEAREAHERCRLMLAARFGAQPAAATQALLARCTVAHGGSSVTHS